MHIPLTFQLIVKRLFYLQTSSTLWSMPTNQTQHILLKNDNSHHSITYPSYFYHLFTQLLLHHDSHTTNSISSSRPPQLISPSCHPCTLPSPSDLLQIICINHPLYQFITDFSPIPLRQPIFNVPTSTPSRSSGLPSYCKLTLYAPGCWDAAPSFLW